MFISGKRAALAAATSCILVGHGFGQVVAPRDFKITTIHVSASQLLIQRSYESLFRGLKRNGFDVIIIPGRDEQGVRYYSHDTLGAVLHSHDNPRYNALGVIRSAHRAGLKVIVTLSVMLDPQLSRRHPRAAATLGDGETPYLDSAGLAWLQPYHPLTCRYASDLARELHLFGADQILLMQLRFKVWEGDGGAVPHYTAEPVEAVRRDVLAQCLVDIKNRSGAPIGVMLPASALRDTATDPATGVNYEALLLNADVVYPTIFPSNLADTATAGDVVATYLQLARVRAARLRNDGERLAKVVPLLQAHPGRNSAGLRFRSIDIADEIKAACMLGFNELGIYNKNIADLHIASSLTRTCMHSRPAIGKGDSNVRQPK